MGLFVVEDLLANLARPFLRSAEQRLAELAPRFTQVDSSLTLMPVDQYSSSPSSNGAFRTELVPAGLELLVYSTDCVPLPIQTPP